MHFGGCFEDFDEKFWEFVKNILQEMERMKGKISEKITHQDSIIKNKNI